MLSLGSSGASFSECDGTIVAFRQRLGGLRMIHLGIRFHMDSVTDFVETGLEPRFQILPQPPLQPGCGGRQA